MLYLKPFYEVSKNSRISLYAKIFLASINSFIYQHKILQKLKRDFMLYSIQNSCNFDKNIVVS